MPVYEYQCNACGDQFELQQKLADPPVKACPKCGGEVKKVISAVASKVKFRKYSKG
jgi:putative FmdB family regulatory protein